MLSDEERRDFRRVVRNFYREHGRHELAWRQSETEGGFDPYKILVSEIMLQQTQVQRVVPKFSEFIKEFPDIESLDSAQLGGVLRVWNGLGYNRRAKFLHQAAHLVGQQYGGIMPQTQKELVSLPGVGSNTAGAILAYAFNQPVVFIETNIRTVFIHHFFADQAGVSDKAILELVQNTLPETDPRAWYWSLMDYGSYLKQTAGNLNRASAHYSKQSSFAGSRRQIRGQIIHLLTLQPQTIIQLQKAILDERLKSVLADLQREGLIRQSAGRFRL